MTIEIIIGLVVGLWFGTTLMVIRNNVMIYKMLAGLPVTYEGTKQINLASWSGICWYASIWPFRILKLVLMYLWMILPSFLLKLVYLYFVRLTIGEKPVPKEVQDMVTTLNEIKKTAQKAQEEADEHENN